MIRLLTLHNFPDVELHVQVWIFTVVAQLDQGDRHHEPPPHTSTRHVSNVWPCCAILDTWNQEACQLRFDEDNLFEHPFIITLLKSAYWLFLQGDGTNNGCLLRVLHNIVMLCQTSITGLPPTPIFWFTFSWRPWL